MLDFDPMAELEAMRKKKKRKAIKIDSKIEDFDPFPAPEGDWDYTLDPSTFSKDHAPKTQDLSLSQRRFLYKIIKEVSSRRKESLKLFRPMVNQEEFFACRAPERVLRGGNRGGKTLSAAVEVARAVTGSDPHGKYPATNGKFACVGWDLQHCADVMFVKLFGPGPFKAIKCPITGDFRSFDPTIKYDSEHEWLAVPSGPLIPKRFIKEISWEDKRRGVARVVRLTTGWEINFYSSKSDPPQGIDIDGAWFDEEIVLAKWYKEISARFLDRRRKLEGGGTSYPMFIWSATPLAGTEQLLDLSTRADLQVGEPNPTTVEFILGLLDNKHISDASKTEFIKKLASEDEYKVRVLGEHAIVGTRIYPEFAPRGMHKIASFPVPLDWTRYCAIDPGRQVCAVLFAAIPPPGHALASHVIVYKELYVKRCDAKLFAKSMAECTAGEEMQEWWIDHQAGRMTEIGSGRTPEEQYSSALKELNVRSRHNEYSFSWGSPDLSAGILAFRNSLNLASDGLPRFLFMTDNLNNFCNEMERYSYKRSHSGEVTDDVIKKNDHLVDCARYLAQADLRYVRPRKSVVASYTNDVIKAKRKKRQRETGWSGAIKMG